MDDRFKIYVEQLRDGYTEKIDEIFSYDFLDIHDENLDYKDQVEVKGEAYLADDNLILNVNIKTFAYLPCVICNKWVKLQIKIDHFYHAEPIEDIKGSVFNYKNVIREIIILETPTFAECNEKCPQRNELAKYFSKDKIDGKISDEGYHPFSDL